MRKQAEKQGVGRVDRDPPVEKSSLGSSLPPNDVATKNDKQKPDGSSTEKLQILSAVKSLKRNLTAFKNASTSDR